MTTFFDILGTSTPVSEVLAEKLGYVRAAIACRVFFYQQLESGLCSASVATLAKKLGMASGTVSNNLKWLRENGFIEVIGEHKSGNVTNRYRVGKKFHDALSAEHSADEREHSPNESNIQEVNGKEELEEDIKEDVTPNGVSAPQKSTTQKQKAETTPIKEKLSALQPKKAIQAKFLELTKLTMPKAKSQCGFWWSQFAEILHAATGDEQRAIQAMETVIPYMQGSNLSITSPKSILGLCRSVLAGQKLNGATSGKTHQRNNTQSFEASQQSAQERLDRYRNAA